MVANVLITMFSAALLIYWLHYTCLLLVKEAKADEHLRYPLFSFPRIRAQLRAGTCDANLREVLASWQQALARDYTVLKYLISRAPVGVEARLLVWDYRLMRCWYTVSRTAFPTRATAALEDMADVVAALACKLKSATAEAR